MPSMAQKWQARRRTARTRREIWQAIDAAPPATRNELIAIAARQGADLFR